MSSAATHPSRLESWIESANTAATDFPLNNLPFGVFSTPDEVAKRVGVAIGDQILDLAQIAEAGFLPGLDAGVFAADSINDFMALGPARWRATRARLIELLSSSGDSAVKEHPVLRSKALVSMAQATLHLPIRVAEYTDFYAGRQHATNVGTMFRGADNALPPNWLHIPIGYNGRASTVVVSGTDVRRPKGQVKPPDTDMPMFVPCRRLDIELELGAIVGQSSPIGTSVSVEQANEMIFGFVLLNDWSARDIQAWEYQPLGPFQAKAFATSISPWVVTTEALASFAVSAPEREKDLLPYLEDAGPMNYDIELEVSIQSQTQKEAKVISTTNASHLYYSSAQQLAHHSVSGCAMNVGDLLGSGTISGDTSAAYGSLLEMSWGGERPVDIGGGESRSFIEDGDVLTLAGYAQGPDYRIGFGHCTGKVLPAHE